MKKTTLFLGAGLAVLFVSLATFGISRHLNGHQSIVPKTATVGDSDIPWHTYRNTQYGFQFFYPPTWTSAKRSPEITDFLTKRPDIEVLDIEVMHRSQTPQQVAQMDIAENNCQSDATPDHIIANDNESVLYVLNCSASSEDYIYLRKLMSGRLLRLTYQDDFDESASRAEKLKTFHKIIASLQVF